MLAKGTEYALRALVYIQLTNLENKRPGVIEIAKEIDAPKAFCAKILQTLTKHAIIKSMKGRGGGFFFDENQSKHSLHEVIVVMEGDGIFHKCGFGLKNCSDENPCPLHWQYLTLRRGFYQIVSIETIQSLAEKIRDGEAVLTDIIQK